MGHSFEDFETIMRDLDSGLEKQGYPAISRPLVAAARYPCPNKQVGNWPPDPSMGPYEGPNLIVSIDNLYKRYYTNKVFFSKGFHSRVVLLRGEPFRLSIPFIFNSSGELDVISHIQDISEPLVSLLSALQRRDLQETFNRFRQETSSILRCQQALRESGRELVNDLIGAGWADLKSCGEGFNSQDPEASLFPAQQATEKFLKSFIAFYDESVTDKVLRNEYNHGVSKLASKCADISPRFNCIPSMVEKLSYGPEVRYKRPGYPLSDVIAKIDTSHEICSLTACLLMETHKLR